MSGVSQLLYFKVRAWPLYTTVHSYEFDFEIKASQLHSFFPKSYIHFRDKYKIIDIRKLCQKNVLSVQKSINQITVAMRLAFDRS